MRFQFFGNIPNSDSFCIFFCKIGYPVACNQYKNDVGHLTFPGVTNWCNIIFCKLEVTKDTRTPTYPQIALLATTVAGRPVVVSVISLLPIVDNGM